MRGQDQLDAERSDSVGERIGLQTAAEPRERFLARSALRAAAGLALVIAPTPDAMVLFGDVGQREKVRERARERHRLAQRYLGQRQRQLVKGRAVAVHRFCELADALDVVEQRLALTFAKHVAQ